MKVTIITTNPPSHTTAITTTQLCHHPNTTIMTQQNYHYRTTVITTDFPQHPSYPPFTCNIHTPSIHHPCTIHTPCMHYPYIIHAPSMHLPYPPCTQNGFNSLHLACLHNRHNIAEALISQYNSNVASTTNVSIILYFHHIHAFNGETSQAVNH